MATERALRLEDIVSKDPSVHGGDLVFAGTRVPARFLAESLKVGESLDQFLRDYPTVERRQAEHLLDRGLDRLEAAVNAQAKENDEGAARARTA